MWAHDSNFPHWKPYSAPKDPSPGAFSSCSFNKAHMSHQSGCLSSPRRNKHLVPIVQGHKQHCFNPDDLHSHIPPLKQNKDEHPNRWEAYSAIFNSCQLFYLEAIKIKYLKEAASALTTNHKNNNLIFNSSLLPSRQWQEPYSPPNLPQFFKDRDKIDLKLPLLQLSVFQIKAMETQLHLTLVLPKSAGCYTWINRPIKVLAQHPALVPCCYKKRTILAFQVGYILLNSHTIFSISFVSLQWQKGEGYTKGPHMPTLQCYYPAWDFLKARSLLDLGCQSNSLPKRWSAMGKSPSKARAALAQAVFSHF